MTLEQVEYLADGLSVSEHGRTLVLDDTRARETSAGVDVSFRIAGTDLAPRVSFTRRELDAMTWEEMSTVLRHVAVRVARAA